MVPTKPLPNFKVPYLLSLTYAQLPLIIKNNSSSFSKSPLSTFRSKMPNHKNRQCCYSNPLTLSKTVQFTSPQVTHHFFHVHALPLTILTSWHSFFPFIYHLKPILQDTVACAHDPSTWQGTKGHLEFVAIPAPQGEPFSKQSEQETETRLLYCVGENAGKTDGE